MKILSRRAWKLALFIGFLAVAGCGDDDDDDNGGPTGPSNPGSSSMSATVDGEGWTAILVSAMRQPQINAIVVGAGGTNSIGLGIAFPDEGPGEYQIELGQITNANLGETGTEAVWIASGNRGSGSITVTSSTKERVVGTFAFTAERLEGTTEPLERVVTEGTFDLVLDEP